MTGILRRLVPVLALSALAVAACDDPTDVDGHAEAEGIAIMEGTTELYRYMLDDGTPVPTLTLPVGLHEVGIVMLDHDGEPLLHDHEEGEEDDFVVTIEDPTVLQWTPEAHTGEEHEHLEFHGELEGVEPGATDMDLCLLHGEHCDFEVVIPVEVTP